MSWDKVSGADHYTIYWEKTSNVTSSSNSINITGNNNTSFIHTGLDNGTTYYYKIASVNSSGTGSLSSEITALTVPAEVENFIATGGRDNAPASGSGAARPR